MSSNKYIIYTPVVCGNTTDSTGSLSGGSFTSVGGVAIAKTLYVGTNIFLAGSVVATQNYITNLGYLTSASAAATYLTISNAASIYQPLIAGTSVSALTLSLTGTGDSTSVSTGSLTTLGGLGVSKNIFVGSGLTSTYYTTLTTAGWYIIGLYDASAAASSTVGCRSEIKILTGSGFNTGSNYGGCVTIQLTTNNNSTTTIANVSGTYFTTGDSSISVSNISFVQNGTNRFAYYIYANLNQYSAHTIHARIAPGVVWTSSLISTTNPGVASSTVSIAVQTFSATIAGMTIYNTSDSISSSSGSLTTLGGLGIAKSLYVGGSGVSASAYAAKIIGNLYVGDPTSGTAVDNIVLGADANTPNGVDLRLGFVKKSGFYPRIISGSAFPVTVSISSSTGIQSPGTSTFTDIGSFALTGLNLIPSTTFVGTSNVSVSSNSASLTMNGDIHFYNSTGAIVYGTAQGQSPPSVATRSTGTRIIFYPSLGSSTVDYAIGIGSNQQFYSVATGGSHVFYINTASTFSISSGSANVSGTFSASSSLSAADITGTNGVISNGSNQTTPKYLLSGQEFYLGGNSSTSGIALLLGVNRTGNRQLWIGDSASIVQNSTNSVIRVSPGTSGGGIDCIATDGVTSRPLNIGNGNTITLSGPVISTTAYHLRFSLNGSVAGAGSYFYYQNTGIYESSNLSLSNFQNSNTDFHPPVTGFWAISMIVSTGGSFEAFISKNSHNGNDLNITGSSSSLLSAGNASELSLNCTVFLNTGDYASFGVFNTSNVSARNQCQITLIQRVS